MLVSSYETINGTAMAGSDYEAKKDVLVFKPGETLKHIDITIIDDDEWEENEVFFLKLSRFDYKDDTVEIGEQSITEVTIINDDGKRQAVVCSACVTSCQPTMPSPSAAMILGVAGRVICCSVTWWIL